MQRREFMQKAAIGGAAFAALEIPHWPCQPLPARSAPEAGSMSRKAYIW